jgi:steroid delta-isomerase-like uncharacterized protein
MSEAHKVLAMRMYNEVISQGDLAALDDMIHDDFVEHEEMPGLPTDKSAPAAFVTMFRSAFPDLHASVEDILQDGDKLVVRARMSGTHKGEFMGMPPTDNKFDIQAIDIVEFRDDKVIAHWGVIDAAAMMGQLGVAPE